MLLQVNNYVIFSGFFHDRPHEPCSPAPKKARIYMGKLQYVWCMKILLWNANFEICNTFDFQYLIIVRRAYFHIYFTEFIVTNIYEYIFNICHVFNGSVS